MLFISSASGGKAGVSLKFYLDTKWVSSGEKATLRTQDPCPLSVPAKLACCLSKKITRPTYWCASFLFYVHLIAFLYWKTQVLLFRSSQSRGFQLNSHVIYFDVTVVRGCDQELGVRGECEGPDGHGVTCREGNQSVCIKSYSLTLKSTVVILDLDVCCGILLGRLCGCFHRDWKLSSNLGQKKITTKHMKYEPNSPSSVWRSFPVAMSKILMIPSIAPLAKYFPSGLWEANQQLKGLLIQESYSNLTNMTS